MLKISRFHGKNLLTQIEKKLIRNSERNVSQFQKLLPRETSKITGLAVLGGLGFAYYLSKYLTLGLYKDAD